MRILQWFICALRNTVNRYFLVFSKIKFHRTDKVSNILDKKKMDILKYHLLKPLFHKICLKMTSPMCVDLNYRYSKGIDPVSISLCFNISLNNSKLDIRIFLHCFKQCCFTGTRGSYQVNQKDIPVPAEFTHSFCHNLICCHN